MTVEFPDLQAHTAVRHGHQLVVAGGCGGSVGCWAATRRGDMFHPGGWPVDPEVCFSDVWSFDPENLRWTQKFGSWMLRFFGRTRKHLNRMFLPVRCYIIVTLLKFDFLLRFHIISSKLTKSKGKVAILSQVFRPEAMEGETRLVFHMNQLGFFDAAFGVWCMYPSGHSATFVGGRMFMFGGCQVTGWVSRGKHSHCAKCQLDSYFGLVVNTVKNNVKQKMKHMWFSKLKLATSEPRIPKWKAIFGSWMDQVSADCFNDVSVLDTMEPCPEQCGGHGTCVDERYCQCTACEAQVMLQCYCRWSEAWCDRSYLILVDLSVQYQVLFLAWFINVYQISFFTDIDI